MLKNAANFAVQALYQNQAQFSLAKQFIALQAVAYAFNFDAALPVLQHKFGNALAGFDRVFLFNGLRWMLHGLGKIAVVGKENQAAAVFVEPAHVKQPFSIDRLNQMVRARSPLRVGVAA